MDGSTSFETSTPMPNCSKGKKRKSLASTPLDPTETPHKKSLIEEDIAEQENERSRHRSIAQVAERISANTLTKENILPQLDACIKLYTNNKIDNTNVWAFMIIDILSEIAKNNTFDNETLKIAASSLDAGSKVYGLRVDCVHSQTLQLASNMMRNYAIESQNAGDDVENQPADGEDEPENKRRKKAPKQKRIILSAEDFPHIVEDVNTLLAPIKMLPSTDLQLNYDGYFNQHLQCDHELRYKFMSQDAFFRSEEDWEGMDMSFYDEYMDYPDDDDSFEINICPNFRNFNCGVNGEDDNEESVMDQNDEVYYDNEGIPIPELDGSIHDPFQDPHYLDDELVVEEEVQEITDTDVEFRREACVGANVEDIGYAYLYQTLKSEKTHTFINLWAGPSHWKLKCIKQAKTTFTGTIEKEEAKTKRKVKKKEPIELTYSEEEIMLAQCRKKHRKKSKKLPRVPPYQLPKKNVDDESHKPMETLRPNYILPKAATQDDEIRRNSESPAEVRNIPSDYNYDNPNDSQYCIDSDDVEAYADAVPANGTQEEVEGEARLMIGDMEWPETVSNNDIGYALTAKRMDMRKLKCAVWDSLVGTNTYATGKIDESNIKVSGEMHFKDIYRELPKIINALMRDGLSSPLAFMALLHLANEKTLFLKGVPTADDIIITQK